MYLKIGGSAQLEMRPIRERIHDAEKRVWRAEAKIKEWEAELNNARDALRSLEMKSKSQGF
jgi:chromosome segregation ATPase